MIKKIFIIALLLFVVVIVAYVLVNYDFNFQSSASLQKRDIVQSKNDEDQGKKHELFNDINLELSQEYLNFVKRYPNIERVRQTDYSKQLIAISSICKFDITVSNYEKVRTFIVDYLKKYGITLSESDIDDMLSYRDLSELKTVLSHIATKQGLEFALDVKEADIKSLLCNLSRLAQQESNDAVFSSNDTLQLLSAFDMSIRELREYIGTKCKIDPRFVKIANIESDVIKLLREQGLDLGQVLSNKDKARAMFDEYLDRYYCNNVR